MKVPTRILNIAKIADDDPGRFSTDYIQLQRIDGKAVAIATDSYSLIVASWSAGNEQDDGWQHLVSAELAVLAHVEAVESDATDVTVCCKPQPDDKSDTVLRVGEIQLRAPSGDKKFPKTIDPTSPYWDSLSDPEATSIRLDPQRLLHLLTVFLETMNATNMRQPIGLEIVLTLSSNNVYSLAMTADVKGVKVAAAIAACANDSPGTAKPVWNPTDLMAEATDEGDSP